MDEIQDKRFRSSYGSHGEVPALDRNQNHAIGGNEIYLEPLESSLRGSNGGVSSIWDIIVVSHEYVDGWVQISNV